ITCGAGRGTGTLRSDLHAAGRINPSDAASAVADLNDVHHGQHHGMARDITADIIAACNFRVKVFDETRFGCGSSHVEGDDMAAVPRTPRETPGTSPPA